MPVEVGVGYVSIVPEMSRFGPELDRQMSRQQGRLQTSVTQPMSDAGAQAGQGAGKGILGGIGGALKGGMAAVAVAGAALFTKAFGDALEQEASGDRLAAQLGLSEKDNARLGKISGAVFAKGYGESVGQVNDSLRALAQNGVAAVNAPQKDLKALSASALNLAETFDAGVGESARAAGQLIRTGLAKDGKEAFDLITRGFQTGADKGEDLLDTLNEYGTQFRDLGLTGKQSIGLLTQGLKAGARDSDTVADALKEFAIRAKDGSDTTKAGFDAIGLSASQMAQTFAKGGPEAGKALDQVLDRLRGIEDPARRSEVAVALFGTKAEDLQQSLYALDPSSAEDALGRVGGAAKRMGDTLHDNASARIERFKRTAMQGLVTFIGGYVIPPLEKLGSVLSRTVGPALSTARDLVGGLFSSASGGEGSLAPLASGLKSVGDTARASFGPAFGRLSESVRTTLLPSLSKLGSVVREDIAPALSTYFGEAAKATYGWLSKLGGILVGTVWPAGMRVYRAWADNLAPIWEKFAAFVEDRAVPAVQTIGDKLSTLVDKAQPLISVVAQVGSWVGQLGAKIVGFAGPILIGVLGTAFSFAFRVFGTAIDIIAGVIDVVVSFGRGVASVVSAVASGFVWLWQNAISPAMSGVRTAVSVAWGIVQPILEVGAAVVRKVVGGAFSWLYESVVKPAMSGISWVVSTAWNEGIRPALSAARTFLRDTLGPAFRWLRDKVVEPVLSRVSSIISGAWEDHIRPAFGALKRGVGTIGQSFETAKDAVKVAWDGIKSATKKPINFVLGTVWNDGLLRAWNAIAGWVDLDKHKLKKVKLLARGGPVWGAGTETSDSIPAMLSHNEHVLSAREVRGLGGHGAVEELRARARAGGHMYKDGGGVLDGLKRVGRTALDKVVGAKDAVVGGIKTAADFLGDPGKALDTILGGILGRLDGMGGGRWGQAIARIPHLAVDGIKRLVMGWLTGGGGGGGGKWARPVSAGLGTRFGVRGRMWASGYHTGSDFPAPTGTPVRAVAAGTVTGAASYGPYGQHITVHHGGGLSSLYAHLSSMGVLGGQRVTRGMRIGAVGSTGNSSGPHLHLEARRGGRPVNPEPLLGYAGGGRPRPGEVAWVGERGPELLRFGGGTSVMDHRSSVAYVAESVASRVGAALVGGMTRRMPQVAPALAAAAPTLSGPQQPAAVAGLPDGQPVVIVLPDGTQLDAYVDGRVEAGMTTVRQRRRAGVKGR
ncbi:phage tail tape measure protein [Streptomyces chumphonensis]|uniref:phage tail tape measure protein n=1 Tax=Streptomyces chumphonensis TaxID=1214925 RepID=UPI003D71F5F5